MSRALNSRKKTLRELWSRAEKYWVLWVGSASLNHGELFFQKEAGVDIRGCFLIDPDGVIQAIETLVIWEDGGPSSQLLPPLTITPKIDSSLRLCW